MAEAAKEGKKALGHFLAKRAPEIVVSTRAPIAGVCPDCLQLALHGVSVHWNGMRRTGGRGQVTACGETDEGRHILMDVSRYLAGHSPTERAALQTADIARRLMRGGELHQKEGASS
jgi:hypothetical protein